MPRYYRYGYQPPKYAALWPGRPAQSRRPVPQIALGDVTNTSHRIDLKPDADPYLLHKKYYQRPFHFAVPKADSPYYLHKYGRRGLGAVTSSNTETQALKIGAAAIAAYFLLLKKGAPLRKKIAKVIK